MRALLIVSSIFLLSACESFTAQRYVPSSTNKALLKSANIGSYNVEEFSLASEESLSVECRMAGPISVAGGGDHADYIKNALVDELQETEKYNPRSSKVFTASFDEIKVVTFAPASWTINGTVSINDRALKPVNVNYPYSTSFTAYSACNNAAENFPYAVEEFIKGVIEQL